MSQVGTIYNRALQTRTYLFGIYEENVGKYVPVVSFKFHARLSDFANSDRTEQIPTPLQKQTSRKNVTSQEF
jgi:hypothetical protein